MSNQTIAGGAVVITVVVVRVMIIPFEGARGGNICEYKESYTEKAGLLIALPTDQSSHLSAIEAGTKRAYSLA